MKITRLTYNYKHKWESRMNAQSNDLAAFHITGNKFAFGLTFTKFASFEQGWAHWYLLTLKIGRMDYKWRFEP